jgi:hypothetical protein
LWPRGERLRRFSNLTPGPEGLLGAAVEALGVHDVAELEAQALKGGELFGPKDATNLHFGVNSHA